MRLSQLLKGTGYTGALKKDPEIAGISYNTATLKPGELFVALRGYKTDGHSYIPQAWEKGAAAILGEDELAAGKVALKDMVTGAQQLLTASEAAEFVNAALASRRKTAPIKEK